MAVRRKLPGLARKPPRPSSAYLDALKMLAGRELSESQVRVRLKRRGHTVDAIDDAVLRLVNERALKRLDDDRYARGAVRTRQPEWERRSG